MLINKFRKDLGLTFTSSIITFIISIGLTPLMTRFFTPSDYGTFAQINNIGTFIATFFIMSLSKVLPRDISWYRRLLLLRTLFFISIVAFIVTLVGVIFFLTIQQFLGKLDNNDHIYLILPFLVLAIIIHRIAQGWAVADSEFPLMAIARVSHPLIAKCFAILSSFLTSPNPIYMLFFEAFGFIIQTIILIRKKINKINLNISIFSRRSINISIAIIKMYKDYSVYHNLVNLIILASATCQIIIITMQFSTSDTGIYSLALGMTNLPVTLVSLATASVIYKQLVLIVSTNSHTLLRKSILLFFGYTLIGVIPYLIIFMYGEDIFGFVFSSDWSDSGKIASYLSVPMLLQFSIYPILSIFMVTDTIKIQFTIDLIFNIIIVVLLFLVSSFYSFMETMVIHSIVLSVYRVASLVFILIVAWKSSKH